MADLRALALEVGLANPRTYIQSGNLVFDGGGTAPRAEATLEKAIAARFGFHVDVVVRTAKAWKGLVDSNPFPEASVGEGSRVFLLLSKSPARADAARDLLAKATRGEQIILTKSAVWGYYPSGMGQTKLAPAFVDRAIGSKVTARNWRTVVELARLVGVHEE
jgi:uncharacterized protein (DUF1697 family)